MSDSNEPERNSLSAREAAELEGEAAIDPEERSHYIDSSKIQEEDGDERPELIVEEEAPGSEITDEMLAEDVDRADSWLAYNKGLEQTGYSPTERITPENVGELEEEYVVETDTSGMQTTPVVTPGDPPVMYFTQQNNVVKAVNARTGDLFWEYRAAGEQTATVFPYNNRGVAVTGDKVITSAWGGRLIALDRYNGELLWESSLLWEENLPEELSEYPPAVAGLTQAPMVYDGIVFIGHVSDQVRWAYNQAFDAETGEVLWRDTNVPPEAWVEDTWIFGNTPNWMNATIDPETETVLFPTGDPAGWYNSMHRPGPNKHSVSIRAYSFDGENKWNHQMLPHELWDYDAGTTVTVSDVELNGEERRVAMINPKDGWVHLIDIETGRLLRRSEPFGKQEHRYGAWPESEYLNLVPIGEENAGDQFPTTAGVSEWVPDAYSPRTNMRYLSSHDSGFTVYGEPGNYLDGASYDDPPGAGFGGTVGSPDDEQIARVAAVDVDSGELVWEYDFAEVEDYISWPPSPTVAGSVVFAPSRGGQMIALDDETGEELWVADTGADSITSTPISWDDPEDGKQYVAIAADDRVVTYALEAEIQDGDDDEDNGDDGGNSSDGGDGGNGSDGGNSTDDDGGNDGDDSDGGDDSVPGFGVGAGVAGLGAGAAAAKRLRDDDGDEGDDQDEA